MSYFSKEIANLKYKFTDNDIYKGCLEKISVVKRLYKIVVMLQIHWTINSRNLYLNVNAYRKDYLNIIIRYQCIDKIKGK